MSGLHLPRSILTLMVTASTLSVVALAGPDSAFSASALVNGTFDTDTSGWTAAGGATLTWDQQDYKGSPNSGSAMVTAVGLSSVRSGSGVFQCVPVAEGRLHLLTALAGAPPSQPRRAFPGYRVAFYGDGTCSGETLELKVQLHPEAEMGKWWVVWRVFQPPSGATHAWIGLMTWGEGLAPGQTATTAQVKWDDVALVEMPRRAVIAVLAAER